MIQKEEILKHSYLILITFLLFVVPASGQKILTTDSGQRTLLVDDGSWRILPQEAKIKGEASTNMESNIEAFTSTQEGKHPITTNQKEKVNDILTNLKSDEAQLIVNIEMSKRKVLKLKADKNKVKKDHAEKKRLKRLIKSTETNIKNDKNFLKETSRLIALSNDLMEGKVKDQEEAFAALDNSAEALIRYQSGMGGSGMTEEVKSTDEDVESSAVLYPTEFKVDDSRKSNNGYQCEIIFDGYDDQIGEHRKEVKTQPFFSYSQDKMKPYFKSEDYLSCDANISKVGKKHYLTLKFRIRSKDANRSYGILRNNENIKIKMINGRSVYGESINTDNGHIESYTGHTLYTGIYELDKGDINELKENYLDHIGIIWSSGYEQYEIYNVDFLTNQIKCLNK